MEQVQTSDTPDTPAASATSSPMDAGATATTMEHTPAQNPSVSVATAPAASTAPVWQHIQPAASDEAAQTAWWQVFGSAELDGLMQRLNSGNFTLQQYEAQYRQAQALAQQAQAGLLPAIGINGGRARNHTIQGEADRVNVALTASWEIDLWGRVRRSVEAGRARAHASAAQLAAVRLSTQAQLASTYLQLVVLDAQIGHTQQLVQGLQELLDLTQHQHRAGLIALDVVSGAQSQLASQRAALAARELARTRLQHAIATLLGINAADFALPRTHGALALPTIPAGVPSALLQTRPDIAAAAHQVQAANAQIGIAQAAYFPHLTLNASHSYTGSALAGLISAPHRLWSLGLALAASLFDGGARSAQVEQARAGYDAAVAAYRQTVLGAFTEVEDQLAAQRLLAEQATHSQTALDAARRAQDIATHQYRAGMVSYLHVISAQNSRIQAENALWSVRENQFGAAVGLIKALGGRWMHDTSAPPALVL